MPMIMEDMTTLDATIIERIPLSRKSKLDKLIWTDSMTGMFLMKSAYFTAR